MSRRSHLRFFLLRWHRRVGVCLGLFLVWMVCSGVVINHAVGLELDTQLVESGFWLARYGSDRPGQFRVGGRLFRHTGLGLLDGRVNLGRCDVLLGVAPLPDMTVVACDSRLLLLTSAGELVEQADAGHGLAMPLDALGLLGGEVFLRRQDKLFRFNPMDMSLSSHAVPPAGIVWQDSRAAPPAISRERLMQDLHSGRILGPVGPWLVDALGLAVVVLAFSGWILARKRHQRA